MIDPLYRRGHVDQTQPAAAKPSEAGQAARQSKFGALMYAMLKPPTLDLSEANGDDDDAPRQPMKAHVKPNLAKLMRELDPGSQRSPTTVAQNPSSGPKQGA